MYSAAMDAVFLSAVLGEAREALEGARVVRIAADGPEGLALEAQGPRGRACLCIGWEAWGPRWYLCAEPPGVRGESRCAAAVARALRGGRITALVRPGMDRTVGIEVACRRGRNVRRWALWAFLWPGRRNVVLVDADAATVIAAARPGAWRPGASFAPPSPGESVVGLDSREVFEGRVHGLLSEGCGAEEALARAFPGLGSILAREVAFRAAGRPPSLAPPPPAAPGPPPGADLRGLWAALGAVARAAREGPFAPRIILGPDGSPQGLAAVALAHLPEDRQRPFPTAGAAADAFCSARREAAEQHEARARAGRTLRQARDRVVRRIQKLEAELAAHRQATAHRQMGEILVAHQRAVPRGAAEARLPDPYGPPGATRAIPLDPSLSVAANVERYFKLARRGVRGEGLAAQRLAEARRELDRITDLEKALADATTPDAFRDLCAAVERLARGPQVPSALPPPPSAGTGVRRTADGSRPPTPGPRPPRVGGAAGRRGAEARAARRFVSTDGLTILVGRNNAGNDELTLHIARPDDLWLHVEGYGGSHVVIRREGRADVPRQTLVEAAQLAAYYSQARGQRKVPVHYTLRKHVRKPKGAKPGLVTITQEKTVFATADANLVRRLAAAAHVPGD